jgi:hypothetical protein
MTKKKTATAVVAAPRKPMALVKKVEKKPAFENMQSLMNKGREDLAAQGAYDLIMVACKVFELPPQGITVLGNAPYINKVGWKIKQKQLLKGSVVKTLWVHYATPLEKYAIVEAKVYIKEGAEVASAIGEATEASIKLTAVKQTLNMMAETRAKNRALFDALVAETYEKALAVMEEMKLSEETKRKIGEAARVTAEEMNEKEQPLEPPKPKAFKGEVVETTNYLERLKIRLYKLGAKTPEQAFKLIEKKTGGVFQSFDEMTEDMARDILKDLTI